MKKILLVGSVLTLISTSALASQARLVALGMKEIDNDGMYHISDSRNIFLNPAYINIYNNYVIAEFGKDGLNVSRDIESENVSATTLDANGNPKAQGGFFKKTGDFVYGLYIGNESNTSSLLRIVGTSALSAVNGATAIDPISKVAADVKSKMLQSADNQLDLFFGGETSVKWGSNITYAAGKNNTNNGKDSSLALRTGVIGSNWDAHLNLSLASKAESTEAVTLPVAGINAPVSVSQEFKGKLGVQLGGSYVVSGNNRAFGYVKHYGWEQTDNYTYTPGQAPLKLGGQKGTVKGDFTSYYVGWGTHFDMNTADKVFVSFSAKKTDINAKFAKEAEVRSIILPLSIAYEAVATEWLTLRGSLAQNIWGSRNNKNFDSINQVGRSVITNNFGSEGKGTLDASTEVNAGATLTFGKFNIDGLIGAKATGSFKTDDLLTRVAATYSF